MKLGEMISFARQLNGMTLRQLEKKTGITNCALSQIETGHVKDPGFKNVVKIALALKIPLQRLAEAE